MEITKLINQVYLEYLEHLNNGGEPVQLPPHVHDETYSKGYIHASALGRCPLQTALSRNHAPMTNPPTNAERMSSLHLMTQGTRDAMPLQEAFVWKFGLPDRAGICPKDSYAEAEWSLYDPGLKVRGRADLHYRDGKVKQDHIIEIKRRDARKGDSQPSPSMSDILQCLAYKLMFPSADVHLVIMNRYYLIVWHLDARIEGGYALIDDDLEPFQHHLNHGGYLNRKTIEEIVDENLLYLSGELTMPPFNDVLNEDASWMCWRWEGDKPKMYKKIYKGKDERTSFVRPRCEHWCWGGNPKQLLEVREVAADSGIYEFVDPDALMKKG